MLKIKTLVVSGIVQFPWDMLRYDQAWPFSQEDSAKLTRIVENGGRVPKNMRPCKIRLLSVATELTPERWNSFLWSMKETSDASTY